MKMRRTEIVSNDITLFRSILFKIVYTRKFKGLVIGRGNCEKY